MKIKLSLIILILFTIEGFSQIPKGSLLLRGNISGGIQSYSLNNSQSSIKHYEIRFSPTGEYFLFRNFSYGIHPEIGIQGLKYNGNLQINPIVSLLVSADKYFGKSEVLPHIGFATGIGLSHYSDEMYKKYIEYNMYTYTRSLSHQFIFRPNVGVLFRINEKIGIDIYIQYYHGMSKSAKENLFMGNSEYMESVQIISDRLLLGVSFNAFFQVKK